MKCVFFDLDGTLLDTLEDLKNAVNSALISFGFPTRSKDYVRLAIGNGTTKLMERCCPEGTDPETRDNALKAFKEYYFHHYNDFTKPFDGVTDLLLKLKKDYKLVVVSNKDDIFTKNLVELYFPNIFDYIQGSYVDKPRKPDPYLINKVLDEMQTNVKECIYIGDTNVDYETANNSKMPVLLVNYGYRTKEETLNQCPDAYIVESYEELEKKIRLILN